MFLSLIFNTVVLYQGERLKDNVYLTLLVFEIAVMVSMHDLWGIMTKPLAVILIIWVLAIEHFYKK